MQAGGDSGTVNVENLGGRRGCGMTHVQVRNGGCNVGQEIGYAHEISVSVPNDILPLDRCVGLVTGWDKSSSVIDMSMITTQPVEWENRVSLLTTHRKTYVSVYADYHAVRHVFKGSSMVSGGDNIQDLNPTFPVSPRSSC